MTKGIKTMQWTNKQTKYKSKYFFGVNKLTICNGESVI